MTKRKKAGPDKGRPAGRASRLGMLAEDAVQGQQGLSARVRQEILRRMNEDCFENGRLPPESVLAESLGVSRTTVRSALQILERDGLIIRRRRVGTYINHRLLQHGLSLHRLVGFSQLLAELGYEPSVQLSARRTTDLDPDWCSRLEVPPTEACLILDKVFMAGTAPALAVLDVIPLRFLRDEPPSEKDIPAPIFEFFSTYGKDPISHAVAHLFPRRATPDLAEKLAMPLGDPYIHIVEKHFNSGQVAMALSYVDVNAHYVTLNVLRQHR